ncbi:MAG: hypothetical protein OEZ58_10395 [Gammaproteobacteria bacterium]|nr:hypothetical protein [Gammaproteobacteria bacterium]
MPKHLLFLVSFALLLVLFSCAQKQEQEDTTTVRENSLVVQSQFIQTETSIPSIVLNYLNVDLAAWIVLYDGAEIYSAPVFQVHSQLLAPGEYKNFVVPVEQSLKQTRTITVAIYTDSNQNQQFDPQEDLLIRNNDKTALIEKFTLGVRSQYYDTLLQWQTKANNELQWQLNQQLSQVSSIHPDSATNRLALTANMRYALVVPESFVIKNSNNEILLAATANESRLQDDFKVAMVIQHLGFKRTQLIFTYTEELANQHLIFSLSHEASSATDIINVQHQWVVKTCTSCHATLMGITPPSAHESIVNQACVDCHNHSSAAGPSEQHMPSEQNCEACHDADLYWQPAFVEHGSVQQRCEFCHKENSGFASRFKTQVHIQNESACDHCHTTQSWLDKRFVHPHFIDQCEQCHRPQGAATAKPTDHPDSNNACQECHDYTRWLGLGNHISVTQPCVDCHELEKPQAHLVSTDYCEACHNTTKFSQVAAIDHTQIIDVEFCNTCHVEHKPQAHIPTGTEQCSYCHTEVGLNWNTSLTFADWHPVLTNACANCHVSEFLGLSKPDNHIITTDNCEACHAANAENFKQLNQTKPEHAQILGGCVMCHSSSPAPGGIVATTVKPAQHLQTSDICVACHSSSTLWDVAPSLVDHTHFVNVEVCTNCHDGVVASYKNETHMAIKTPELCEACHSVGGHWTTILQGVDHTQAIGDCESAGCHINDKSAQHFPSSNACATCHFSTSDWTDANFIHNVRQINNCISCHNAITTTSYKSEHHLSSSDICEACHNVTSWVAVRIDHSELSGDCHLCHLNEKSMTHIASSNQCAACHSTAAWSPAITVNHDHVVGFCVDCHRAAKTTATAHINSSDKCEACHTTSTWKPAVSVDHVQVFGVCIDCHNRVIALGKSDQHILSDDQCAACHNINQFMPAAFVDHSHLNGSCSSCHSFSNISPQHPETVQECNACHSTASWAEIVQVNHAGLINGCSTCHNNINARGAGVLHITNSELCERCHMVTTWLNATVDHAQVSGTCFSCHNNSPFTGKTSTHMPTSDVCESCHQAGIAWIPATTDHLQVAAACSVCHSQGSGFATTFKSAGHIASGNQCDECHDSVSWVNSGVDHTQIDFTGTPCETCHIPGGGATPKSNGHPNTSNACAECHSYINWTPIRVDHAQVIGSCADVGCHSIPTGHISSGNQCQACHSTSVWVPVLRVDHVQTQGWCADCHIKNVQHELTDASCHYCHSTSFWKPLLTRPNHPPVVGACGDCHEKTVTHINSIELCFACHSLEQWKPLNVFDHQYVFGACQTCHASPGSHVAVGITSVCDACHGFDVWSNAVYDLPSAAGPAPPSPPAPAPTGGGGGLGMI